MHRLTIYYKVNTSQVKKQDIASILETPHAPPQSHDLLFPLGVTPFYLS